MKKIFFLVAICVVLAGSFFFFQKREEAVEARIDSFVAENLNKPYHIKGLEQFPFIRKATLTLTKYKKEQADSLFHLTVLDLDQNEKQVDIPLISSISRGKSEHEGDSFGFAHIVTHPVVPRPGLLAMQDGLPEKLKELIDGRFRLEHFIGNDGSLRELYLVEPIIQQNDGKQTIIGGGQVRVDTSVFDRSAYDLVVRIEKMLFQDKGTVELNPFTFDLHVDNKGKYTGKSSVLEVRVNEDGLFHVSEGTCSGQIKRLDGLDMDFGTGQARFDLVSFKDKEFDFALENLECESGLYEAGDKLFDLKWALAARPKITSPAILPAGADIQQTGLQYELKKVSAEALNTFQTLMLTDSLDKGSDTAGSEKLLREVQQSGTEFVFSVFLNEAKGKGEIKGRVMLNSAAKQASFEELRKAFTEWNQMEKWIDVDGELRVDKAVADVLNMTPLFQLQPQYFALEENIFSSSVVLKDGNLKVNGQEQDR